MKIYTYIAGQIIFICISVVSGVVFYSSYEHDNNVVLETLMLGFGTLAIMEVLFLLWNAATFIAITQETQKLKIEKPIRRRRNCRLI